MAKAILIDRLNDNIDFEELRKECNGRGIKHVLIYAGGTVTQPYRITFNIKRYKEMFNEVKKIGLKPRIFIHFDRINHLCSCPHDTLANIAMLRRYSDGSLFIESDWRKSDNPDKDCVVTTMYLFQALGYKHIIRLTDSKETITVLGKDTIVNDCKHLSEVTFSIYDNQAIE